MPEFDNDRLDILHGITQHDAPPRRVPNPPPPSRPGSPKHSKQRSRAPQDTTTSPNPDHDDKKTAEPRATKFRFKKKHKSSHHRRCHDNDDGGHERERKRRKPNYHVPLDDDPTAYDDAYIPNAASWKSAVDPDAAFRESLFDAMADDEGAAFWEGVYGQPVHVYERPGMRDEKGHLEQMSDDEYTRYVREKMWEKSHEHIIEERRRRAEQREWEKKKEREKQDELEKKKEREKQEEWEKKKDPNDLEDFNRLFKIYWETLEKELASLGPEYWEGLNEEWKKKKERMEEDERMEKERKKKEKERKREQEREWEKKANMEWEKWERAERRAREEAAEKKLKRDQRERMAKEKVQIRWKEYLEAWEAIMRDGGQAVEYGNGRKNKAVLIPWPVASGRLEDVTKAAVERFMLAAPTSTQLNLQDILKRERIRWHPDKAQQRWGKLGLGEEERKTITAVFQIIDALWVEGR